jgi:thiol-disulfide isomerase/thioredoxin
MMNRSGVVSIALLCSALSQASSPTSQAEVPTLAEIREHGFMVTDLDGSAIPLSSLVGDGKPLVVEFWATWCAPCRKTLPTLLALQRKYGDELVIVGLSVEDPDADMSRVQEYVKREVVNFPIAFSSRELFQFMNSRPDIAVPKLFVFDSGGSLVSYIPRYSPFTSRKLKSAVKDALAQHKRLKDQ